MGLNQSPDKRGGYIPEAKYFESFSLSGLFPIVKADVFSNVNLFQSLLLLSCLRLLPGMLLNGVSGSL